MNLTVRDVFSIVIRYSRALVAFWSVIVVALVIFFSQTAKQYDSNAEILVSLGSEALGKADYLDSKFRMTVQREQQLHNEEEMLQSHEVMSTVAAWILGDPGYGSPATATESSVREARRFLTGEEPQPTFLLQAKDAVMKALDRMLSKPATQAAKFEGFTKSLAAGLTVKPVFDSDSFEVTYRYRDPGVAQTVLKLTIEAYLRHHIAVFQNSAEADLLRSQLERSVARYQDRLSEFSSFMAKHHLYNDESQVAALVEEREKVERTLNDALADTDSARARLAVLRSIQKSIDPYERFRTTEERNKEREALLSKLDEAAIEERALLNRHPQGSRADQEEQSKLLELRQLLESQPEKVVQETEQRRSEVSELVDSQVVNVTAEQNGHKARVEQLRADLRSVEAEISDYTKDLKGFDSLKLQLALAKQESEQMAQGYLDSRLKSLTAQNAITDISIIEAPTWDSEPASPKKRTVIAAAMLLLLAGSLATLLACYGLDTTIADAGTAESRLGTPVVETLPFVKAGANGKEFPARFTSENHREYARIYQSVRNQSAEGKIVLVAESHSGEGSSLVGYGLARFLSRFAHENTAFIDHTANALNPGVTEADADRLTVLPWPVSTDEDPAAVLTQLRTRFDYIVIAAGSVKDAPELLAISGLVAATFLIVEAGKTRRPAARYNLELLQRYGFEAVKLILNKRVYYIPGWLMRLV